MLRRCGTAGVGGRGGECLPTAGGRVSRHPEIPEEGRGERFGTMPLVQRLSFSSRPVLRRPDQVADGRAHGILQHAFDHPGHLGRDVRIGVQVGFRTLRGGRQVLAEGEEPALEAFELVDEVVQLVPGRVEGDQAGLL